MHEPSPYDCASFNFMAKLKNPKHELYSKLVVKEKGNLGNAYAQIYQSNKIETCQANASRLFARPEIRSRIAELLELSGIPIERLNKKLSDLLEAEKAMVVGKKIEYTPDNATQSDMLKVAYKLYGLIGNDSEVYQDNRSISINVPVQELNSIVNSLKNINDSLLTDTIALSGKVNSTDTSKSTNTLDKIDKIQEQVE